MHIEHVAFWTNDLDRIVGFYVQYFNATVGPKYTNPSKGFESYFLSFETGARLEFMKTTELDPLNAPPGAQRMGLTHLAVSVGSASRVNSITEQIQSHGFPVLDSPHRTGDGYYESVVLDPDGNRVEITI